MRPKSVTCPFLQWPSYSRQSSLRNVPSAEKILVHSWAMLLFNIDASLACSSRLQAKLSLWYHPLMPIRHNIFCTVPFSLSSMKLIQILIKYSVSTSNKTKACLYRDELCNILQWKKKLLFTAGTETGYRVDGRGSIPGRVKWLFCTQRPGRLWDQPASWGKAAGTWSWPFTSV
jgi:hypothetical protein